MTQRTTDAEKLAALLDGRLNDADRSDVLTRIAASDERFEAYAEAVAVTRELEAEDEAEGVVPLRSRRQAWWHGGGARALAAVAGLAVILALPWLLDGDDDPDLEPGTFVALLGTGASALPAERPAGGWPARRGAGGQGDLGRTLRMRNPPGLSGTQQAQADRERALRLGAELVWLELAVHSGDVAGVRRASAEIDSLLDSVPAGAPLGAVYRSVSEHPDRPMTDLHPLLEQASAALTRLVDEDMLNLGAWVASAGIAAERQQRDFFTAPATRSLLESAATHETLSEAAKSALATIRDETAGGGELDWPRLRGELAELPRVLASG